MPVESLGLAPQAKPFPTKVISVVVPASLQDDPALSLAIGDLLDALSASGLRGTVSADNRLDRLSPYAILVGDERNKWIADLYGASLLTPPSVADEG